eukprot:5370772-Prymnesium_polylepis.1
MLYTLLGGRTPFASDDCWAEELLAAREGRWSFDEPTWADVSVEAKDAVRRLLTHDAGKRPTAAEAVHMKWLQCAGESAAEEDSCCGGGGTRVLPGSATLLRSVEQRGDALPSGGAAAGSSSAADVGATPSTAAMASEGRLS